MEDNIETLLKSAESIVNRSGISSTLRPTAFGEVFRVLWQTDSLGMPVTPVERQQTLGNRPRPAPPISAKPAALVQKLIDDGFLKQPKRDIDVQAKLQVVGFNIPRKQIATVLVRKVRIGQLQRDKSDNGYVYFTS